jgi:hypothetical protein
MTPETRNTPLDKLDRILATEEELLPSSGFMASVMEAVQKEATVLPPIPFPWKRVVPGFAAAAGILGWGAFELVRLLGPAVPSLTLASPQLSAPVVVALEEAGWVAGALAASLLCWLLSRRLAGSSGLL